MITHSNFRNHIAHSNPLNPILIMSQRKNMIDCTMIYGPQMHPHFHVLLGLWFILKTAVKLLLHIYLPCSRLSIHQTLLKSQRRPLNCVFNALAMLFMNMHGLYSLLKNMHITLKYSRLARLHSKQFATMLQCGYIERTLIHATLPLQIWLVVDASVCSTMLELTLLKLTYTCSKCMAQITLKLSLNLRSLYPLPRTILHLCHQHNHLQHNHLQHNHLQHNHLQHNHLYLLLQHLSISIPSLQPLQSEVTQLHHPLLVEPPHALLISTKIHHQIHSPLLSKRTLLLTLELTMCHNILEILMFQNLNLLIHRITMIIRMMKKVKTLILRISRQHQIPELIIILVLPPITMLLLMPTILIILAILAIIPIMVPITPIIILIREIIHKTLVSNGQVVEDHLMTPMTVIVVLMMRVHLTLLALRTGNLPVKRRKRKSNHKITITHLLRITPIYVSMRLIDGRTKHKRNTFTKLKNKRLKLHSVVISSKMAHSKWLLRQLISFIKWCFGKPLMVINILPKITNMILSHVSYLNQLNLSLITMCYNTPTDLKYLSKCLNGCLKSMWMKLACNNWLVHCLKRSHMINLSNKIHALHLRTMNDTFASSMLSSNANMLKVQICIYFCTYLIQTYLRRSMHDCGETTLKLCMPLVGLKRKNIPSLPHGQLSNAASVKHSKQTDGNDNSYNLRIMIILSLLNKLMRKLMSSLLDKSARTAIVLITIQKIVGMLHIIKYSVSNCLPRTMLVHFKVEVSVSTNLEVKIHGVKIKTKTHGIKIILIIKTGILGGIIHVTNAIIVVVADMLLVLVVVVVEVEVEAEVGDITATLDLHIIIKLINTVMLTLFTEARRVTKLPHLNLFRLHLNSLSQINNISNHNRMLLLRKGEGNLVNPINQNSKHTRALADVPMTVEGEIKVSVK